MDPRAGARINLPALTEENDIDADRVGLLESNGSTQPASKVYIPLREPTQPTNQTQVGVG